MSSRTRGSSLWVGEGPAGKAAGSSAELLAGVGRAKILLGDGSGQFTLVSSIEVTNPAKVVAGDFDEDGYAHSSISA